MSYIELGPIDCVRGTVRLPGSKSISNRTLLLAALAEGDTRVRDVLDSDDTTHMLGASLATCTMAVLLAWADTIKLSGQDMSILLEWSYAEGPYRIGEYRMTIDWPGLPEKRRPVALRVAEQCTVDATLRFPPFIDTRIAGAAE